MNVIFKENILKNLLIVIILVITYLPIEAYISSSILATDKTAAGSIIVMTSIIAVTACFGNFAFTYEKINVKWKFERYLAHVTTGISMLVIGISLEFTDVLTVLLMGRFYLVDGVLVLLYLAVAGYDFWDLLRVLN
jgi:hypothetical protein